MPKELKAPPYDHPATAKRRLAQMKQEEKINNDALEANKATWAKQYAGKWVAIHQGKVVAARTSKQRLNNWLDTDQGQRLTGDVLLHEFLK
ncbi:MAG: DUF5678 domain-containing protein [Patescibacteria group bacterium]